MLDNFAVPLLAQSGPLTLRQLTSAQSRLAVVPGADGKIRDGPIAAVVYRLLNWKERPPCKRHLLRAERR